METGLVISRTTFLPSQTKAAQELPIGLQKFVLAKDSPIIIDLPKIDAIKWLYSSIAETIVNIGWKELSGQDDAILNMAEAVYNLLFEKHPTVTIKEFKLALLNGSLEYYGKYTVFSFKTLSDWLKGYSNDELKKKAMSEWNKAIDHVSIKEKTPEQKEAIIRDGCLHAFEDYKKNIMVIPVDHLCGVFYTYLKENGLINFSPEKRIELYDLAHAEYLSGVSKFRGQMSKDIYGSILQSMSAKKDEPQNRSFGNMCKRYALLEYFDTLLSQNKELNELIIR